MAEYMDAQTASIAKGGDGCCHKTRMKDSPCPIGWKCPYIKAEENLSATKEPPTHKQCGSCANYWSLEGQSVIPIWGEPNMAGTCRTVAGQPFRLFGDKPILNCWSGKE